MDAAVAVVREMRLDGLNFDVEERLDPADPRRGYYAAIVGETRRALHMAVPGSSVSVDVYAFVADADSRARLGARRCCQPPLHHHGTMDVRALANASDLLYVMGYNDPARAAGRCVAGGNSPIGSATLGLSQFLEAGVSASKLVLGVPWYGFGYPCLGAPDARAALCPTASVPWDSGPCSGVTVDGEQSYGQLMARLNRGTTTTGRRYDNATQQAWFNYRDAKDADTHHQLWFDDPESLRPKYELARRLGLGGVGPYEFSDLDYNQSDAMAARQTRAMWLALRAFTG